MTPTVNVNEIHLHNKPIHETKLFHKIRWIINEVKFLCVRPNRPHYGSRSSVCLYVRPSVTYGLLTRKQKKTWKPKIGANVLPGRSNRCANQNVKGRGQGQSAQF